MRTTSKNNLSIGPNGVSYDFVGNEREMQAFRRQIEALKKEDGITVTEVHYQYENKCYKCCYKKIEPRKTKIGQFAYVLLLA
jgi:Cu2+-containing amine oxidase